MSTGATLPCGKKKLLEADDAPGEKTISHIQFGMFGPPEVERLAECVCRPIHSATSALLARPRAVQPSRRQYRTASRAQSLRKAPAHQPAPILLGSR